MIASRLGLVALFALPASAFAAGLGGSRASMRRQHAIAVRSDFTFARTSMQLRDLIADERLLPVRSTSNLLVTEGVSFAYTRPILMLFLNRIAAQYRMAMGERLVVTSLMRPMSLQPRNASPLSVHPAGMAIDFRIPDSKVKRAWLEQTLLALEDGGVLDVTRERRPAHYHVAVFPAQYGAYLSQLGVDTTTPVVADADAALADDSMPVVAAAALLPASPMVTSAANGMRYMIFTAATYFLAVLGASVGTLRRTRR